MWTHQFMHIQRNPIRMVVGVSVFSLKKVILIIGSRLEVGGLNVWKRTDAIITSFNHRTREHFQ